MINSKSYLLGIDYGTKYIGLAIGQTITNTASPIKVIKKLSEDLTLKEIDLIMGVWNPKKIVIGYPEQQDNTKFLTDLDSFYSYINFKYNDVMLIKVSEHLSSRAALWQLKQLHIKRNRVDAYAACLILESWMSSENT